MDEAHKKSEEELKRLIDRIKRIYTRALTEVNKKLEDNTSSFFIKDKKKREDLANGKITEEQYKRWREGQFFIQGRWQALAEDLASDLAKADSLAMSLVSDNMVNTYVDNYNYGLFDVDSKSQTNVSFTAYNRQNVLNLIKDNPDLLPLPDIQKSNEYDIQWNRDRIMEEFIQSTLQGEDYHQLADRLQRVTNMDRNSAIRNARTLSTSAENKGRFDSMLEAENKGIPMFKQWVATEDERTRTSHMKIHYQVRRLHEPFGNGLQYPGDTSTNQKGEVYNCRCTLVANPYGINPAQPATVNENNTTGGRGFKQWVKEHILHE